MVLLVANMRLCHVFSSDRYAGSLYHSGFIIGIAFVFFVVFFVAKTLIEHTPKNNLGKHPPTQNNPLVVICNEYWSTSKYQVKRKQYVYLGHN